MNNSRFTPFVFFAISILILNAACWVYFKNPSAVPCDKSDSVIAANAQQSMPPITPTTNQQSVTNQPPAPQLHLTHVTTRASSFGDPQISFSFNDQPDLKDIQLYVRSEPEYPLTITPYEYSWEEGFRVAAPFKPGEQVTIIFSPTLKSLRGVPLAREIRRTVLIPHRTPRIEFDAPGRYLAPQGKLTIPVRSVNCTSLVSVVSRVLPQNLVFFAKNDRYSSDYRNDGYNADELTQGGTSLTNRIASLPDKEQRSYIHLSEQIPQGQRGVYLLAISNEHWNRETRLVCVTDIGVSVREEPQSYTAWITSLSTGKPTPDCNVKLYGINNALLAEGKTDKDGFVRVNYSEQEGAPFLMVVSTPDLQDFTFLALSSKNQVEQMTKTSDSFLKDKTCEAFVFTDREIYRHGETVFAQALLRLHDNTSPEPFPVFLKVMKPNGKLFKTIPLMADVRGCVTSEVVMPDYLPSGTYRLHFTLPGTDGALLGQGRFALESFVPPQIRVKHLEVPQSVKAGESLVATIGAEHLFGKPADGLKYENVLLLKPVPFKPQGWEDYVFGDDEKTFSVTPAPAQKGELDSRGQACVTNQIPNNLLPPARLDAIVQSTVIEAGGRPVTARVTIPVHPYPFYIGIKNPATSFFRSGREQKLNISAVLPDGQRKKEPVALEVKLECVSWISNYRRDDRGYYQWESHRLKSVVSTNTLTYTGEETAYTLNVPLQAGDYLLTFTDPITKASTSWRFGASQFENSAVAWDRSSPDRVKLVFDKEEYLPGDTVRLQIRSPFPGLAWVTLQQKEILENRVLLLTNTTAEVTWTAQKAWSPNLEVAVSIIRPATAESVWSAHRASGIEALRVTPLEHKLTALITTSQPVVIPQTTLPVKVVVTDSNGQPAKNAAITLLAVDEGICTLTGMKTPSPYTFFKRIRTGGLSLYDVFTQLMPITDDQALNSASHAGGGGDDGGEDFAMKRVNPIASRRFKPVALWKQNIETDENGSATVQLALPEFTGELRLMAIAWNKQATGSSEASIKVKRKLIVQPDLPRFLAPDDQATFQVTLHNESGAPTPVQITATATGPLSLATPTQQVQLAAGESRSVLLPATALEQVGLAKLSMKVEGAGELYTETFELAVRPAVAWENASEHLVLKPQEEKTLKPSENCLPSTFSQTVYVSPQPTINLVGALEYVVHYPYGCLEQTTSSVFPLIPLKELSKQVAFKNSTLGQEAPDMIQAAVSRILSMQRYDGFSMWPSGHYVAHYESVYASHFLVEAANAGYSVPPDVVPFCAGFLQEALRQDNGPMAPYASHVLALAKRPDHNAMLRLFEKANSLNAEDRFHLARALIRSGDAAKGLGVLQTVKSVQSLREAAFGLMAWCELDPASSFAFTCAREIEKKRMKQGHWGSTQDNALALLALGMQAQHVDLSKSGGQASVLWNGSEKQIPVMSSTNWTAQAAVTLKNISPVPLYLTRLTEAVPLNTQVANVDEGIAVRRRFVTSLGIETNVTEITRGDLLWIQITIDPNHSEAKDLIIEDLLPAGLEIETGQDQKAFVARDGWILHREVRDDRLLLFANPVRDRQSYTYAVRAVTAGDFILPAISASAMYDPGVYSRHGATRIKIK
jgi:alpha-2-macroglobulin